MCLTNYNSNSCETEFTQSVGYLGRTELEEVKSIEQVEMFNKFDNYESIYMLMTF